MWMRTTIVYESTKFYIPVFKCHFMSFGTTIRTIALQGQFTLPTQD